MNKPAKKNYTTIGFVFFSILTFVFTYSLIVDIWATRQREILMQALQKEGIKAKAYINKVYTEVKEAKRKTGELVYKVDVYYADLYLRIGRETLKLKKNLGTLNNFNYYQPLANKDSVEVVFLAKNPKESLIFTKHLAEYKGVSYWNNDIFTYLLLIVVFFLATLASVGVIKIPI